MKKTIIIIVSIIIIIILLFLYFNYSKRVNLQDDFIFFKLFSNYQNKQTNSYIFNVNYQKLKFKEVKLFKTIDKKHLLDGKIAPGTNGNFEILINSNKDSQYQVKFKEEALKPENLKFYYKNQEYNELKQLEKVLNGEVKKQKPQYISIYWEWEYENNKDEIDTKDGKTIRNYKFEIGVIGIKKE